MLVGNNQGFLWLLYLPGHYFPLDFPPWYWSFPPGLVWELQES